MNDASETGDDSTLAISSGNITLNINEVPKFVTVNVTGGIQSVFVRTKKSIRFRFRI